MILLVRVHVDSTGRQMCRTDVQSFRPLIGLWFCAVQCYRLITSRISLIVLINTSSLAYMCIGAVVKINPRYITKRRRSVDTSHTRVLFSARQHICYSALYAIARPSVRLSVRPSVRHTGGSVKDGYS